MMLSQEKRRRVSSLVIRLGVFTMLLLPLPIVAACGTPRAVVDNAVYDAGEVPQGQKITHTFILKNTGDADLTINIKRC